MKAASIFDRETFLMQQKKEKKTISDLTYPFSLLFGIMDICCVNVVNILCAMKMKSNQQKKKERCQMNAFGIFAQKIFDIYRNCQRKNISPRKMEADRHRFINDIDGGKKAKKNRRKNISFFVLSCFFYNIEMFSIPRQISQFSFIFFSFIR